MQQITASKKTRIIDLLRASGEEDLGAGLLRLAHLAAATHRYEAAQAARQASEVGRANGLARSPQGSVMLTKGRGSDRMEVIR